jgi:hypothetical protein
MALQRDGYDDGDDDEGPFFDDADFDDDEPGPELEGCMCGELFEPERGYKGLCSKACSDELDQMLHEDFVLIFDKLLEQAR